MERVIVGLGNPGKEYALTRHNLGFLVVQAFAARQGWEFKEDRQYIAQIAKGKVNNSPVHLLLPLTYMNASGQSVNRYLDYYKLYPSNIIVVSDDIALEFGDLRVRSTGSAGGHKGLLSIEQCLHTQHFVRLRMGIGRSGEKPLADYVLDRFTREEDQQLPEVIEKGVNVLTRLIQEEVTVVMNAVNVKQKPKGIEL